MGPVLGDQKEGRKQGAFPVKEQKRCANINATREGPNGRRSKDLTLKIQTQAAWGKMGPKKRKKNMESHLEGKLDKPDRT